MRFHFSTLMALCLLLAGSLVAAFPASSSSPSQTIPVACASPHCTPPVVSVSPPTSFLTSTVSASPSISPSTVTASASASLIKKANKPDHTLPDLPSDLRDYIANDPSLHGQAKSVASFMLGHVQLSKRTDDSLPPSPPPSDLRNSVPDDPSLRAQAKSVASAVLGLAQGVSRVGLLNGVCGSSALKDAHRQLDNTALSILSLTCDVLGAGGH